MAITTKQISFYNKISNIESTQTISFDLFLESIKDGKWEDEVNKVRVIKDEKERNKLKQRLPSVTISGKFSIREDEKMETHSGLIGIDIDEDGLVNLSLNDARSLIQCDKHVVACFASASGRGLCVVFRINPSKHREAFQGICEYIYNTYGLICDPTSVNPSRPRFVSFDPFVYINEAEDIPKFVLYPKEKPIKKIERVIFAKNDFEQIIQQICSRRIDLTKDSYFRYLRIGFALSHQFGEAGRNYFHLICQFGSKYDSTRADKQYNACLRHKSTNETTISTIYYFCKLDGIELYSERTKAIAYTTSNGKKAGLKPEQIAENLKKFENITDAEDIIKQVYDSNIELHEDTVLDQLEMFMRQNFELRRNAVTRYIENNGKILQEKDMNSIFIKCKKVFEGLTFDLMNRLINSDFIPEYNPFFEFFEQYKEIKPTGQIDKLFSSIENIDPEYCKYFGKKWLVGIISAIHGIHSPLFLSLLGDVHGTGKTEFFRRLLPKELFSYYAESKLDAGKDDYILMTQKLLVVDDEMGGKSKKEEKLLKDITSKQVFTLREPYGRNNVDLVRLAVLGGTSNEYGILADRTGNRRIIPVMVKKINFELYNSVDKIELLMEAYWLYKDGFNWQVLGEDIKYLRQDEEMFEIKSIEQELVQKWLRIPEDMEPYETLTSTDIKVWLESLTNQRLSLNIIGKELQKAGFQQIHKKIATTTARMYKVVRVEKELPF